MKEEELEHLTLKSTGSQLLLISKDHGYESMLSAWTAPERCTIIKLETNQGLVGLGEVRDGQIGDMLCFSKARIKGMNPCSVEQIFKRIKQFGFHGRQGGGVCGVEMAL